jgi:hypothetical protein
MGIAGAWQSGLFTGCANERGIAAFGDTEVEFALAVEISLLVAINAYTSPVSVIYCWKKEGIVKEHA